MTDKQIMECKYKFQSIEKFAGKPYCTLHNETCEFINFACDKNCQVYEDYKQLKRKEQECEELNTTITNLENIRDEFSTKLDQLKAENEKLKKQVCGLRPELKYIIDKTCCKYNINAKYYHEKIIEIINNLDKYTQTLAEIREIIKKAQEENGLINISTILQKINEVEDENM
jgi:chromosome segregation ATPase